MSTDWFNFTLGFSNDGCDGDTVRHILGVLNGLVVRVEQHEGDDAVIRDVVVDSFEQIDDEALDYPVILTGWVYDAAADNLCGSPVRIPLAGARVTIH